MISFTSVAAFTEYRTCTANVHLYILLYVYVCVSHDRVHDMYYPRALCVTPCIIHQLLFNTFFTQICILCMIVVGRIGTILYTLLFVLSLLWLSFSMLVLTSDTTTLLDNLCMWQVTVGINVDHIKASLYMKNA